MSFTNWRVIACLAIASSWLAPATAHHGPGTTGSGISTASGETVGKGKWSLELLTSYTDFESLSVTQIENKARSIGGDEAHLETLDYAFFETFRLDYGVSEWFQFGFSIGWYSGQDLVEGEVEDGDFEIESHGDVSGLTDLQINSRLRLAKGPYGTASLLFGIKFPTGEEDESSDETGNALEPSLQPGSGASDFIFGIAWSAWITSRATADASLQYTYRTEDNNFKIGDRIDAGVSLGYRLTGDNQSFPQFHLFLEANVLYLEENEEDGVDEINSGGTELFLSPGLRARLTERLFLSVSPQFPVAQDLNSVQQETDYKVSVSLSYSF